MRVGDLSGIILGVKKGKKINWKKKIASMHVYPWPDGLDDSKGTINNISPGGGKRGEGG